MWEGKCEDCGKGRRAPPSMEREIWILVSLVMRFRTWVRRGRGEVSGGGMEACGSGAIEPMVGGEASV